MGITKGNINKKQFLGRKDTRVGVQRPGIS